MAKKTDDQIKQDKHNLFMKMIAKKAAYFREYPHRWCSEFAGIHLKPFQKILIYAFNKYNYAFYCAARGQGKSWLTALFCCYRAICYPGSKIVVCSYTRKQGNEVLLKIQDDFMKNYPMIASEIEKCNVGQNEAAIYFKNHSWIRVVTASDSGRGARANVLISKLSSYIVIYNRNWAKSVKAKLRNMLIPR